MLPKSYFFLSLFLLSTFSGIHCGRTPQAIPLVDIDPNMGAPNISGAPVYYPHFEGWKDPANHGAAFLSTIQEGQDPESSLCITCHNFSKNAPTCNSCHPTFPHTEDWENPINHGTYVRENGVANCATTCHGNNFTGGLSGVTCYNSSCHPSYPHNNRDQWIQPDQHGLFALLNGKEGCKHCHGDDFQGGISGKTCYNAGCHMTFPHTEDWIKAEQHGVAAYGEGKDSCDSANCHAPDFSGRPPLVPGCTSQNCHPNYPHELDPNWLAGANSTHAPTFITQVKSGEDNACAECHGPNYDRMINGVSCTAAGCHANGVTHRNLPEPWANGQGHGAYYVRLYSHPPTVDTWVDAYCRDCHGAPAIFTRNDTLEGLKQQSDCYGCHWAFPHVTVDSGQGINGQRNLNNWVPAKNVAHVAYLLGNPLFVGANGNRPPPLDLRHVNNNVIFNQAIENTCGGSQGNCHFDGRGAPHNPIMDNLPGCAGYCHKLQ